ncbi:MULTISPECIES: LysE family translocator [unclassified Ruegeria]|uniref:LysE family translocator n=1 Tax=unclassified Ruegeria TaxID=2625375 RepID=UPI001489CFB0|nr:MULTISPECIES: LysE family translocator [unclassified Ruegeria]NOD90675.1 LysE family transporter [Ruegeria sp. HKCCD4318]NOE15822.1 LysE family transporter [Ruegeria sp. HKCCD4318-2]NOG07904.1 LysE family translocator [Ruegeria sp. HKCCD4315]
MSLDIWFTYVATVLLLMSTPGPSQLLMLSNSATNGLRRGLFTAVGDLTANFLQMLAAGLGLAALIATSATALTVIKWLGVAYLVYLGVKQILKARVSDTQTAPKTSRKSLWMQGFITSAANPKAVVFFAALFPLFIDGALPFWPQFAILSATYLVMDGMFLTAYGGSASWLARRLQGPAKLWLDRIGGSFMILAAILLGLKSLRPST